MKWLIDSFFFEVVLIENFLLKNVVISEKMLIIIIIQVVPLLKFVNLSIELNLLCMFRSLTLLKSTESNI